ncbi:MAG: hypothetical protein NXI28_24490 [bacterium]|nr:hypothetical protein [bacterium]
MENQKLSVPSRKSYGGFGRKPADPTPRQVKERCREILIERANRLASDRALAKRRQRQLVAVLRRSGGLNRTNLAMILRYSNPNSATLSEDLETLLASGRIIRQGRTNRCLFKAVDDQAAGLGYASDLPSNDVAFRRVTRRA